MFCPQCGTQNDSDARFCQACGAAQSVVPLQAQSVAKPVSAKGSKKLLVLIIAVVVLGTLVAAASYFFIGGHSGVSSGRFPFWPKRSTSADSSTSAVDPVAKTPSDKEDRKISFPSFFGNNGGKLGRSLAEDKIKNGAFPGTQFTHDLPIGFVVAEYMAEHRMLGTEGVDYTPNLYKNLEKLGVVRLERLSPAMLGERFNVTIPEDIEKKYVKGFSKRDVVQVEVDGKRFMRGVWASVVTGNHKFNEITGIVQKDENSATVEYTIRVENTPFGKAMYNIREDVSIVPYVGEFTRYDDGWRLKGSRKPGR